MVGTNRTPQQLDLLAGKRPQAEREELRALRALVPERIHFGTPDWRHSQWGEVIWDSASDAAALDRDGLKRYAAHPLFSVACFVPGEEVVTARELRRYHAQLPEGFPWLAFVHGSVTAPKFAHAAGFGDHSGRVNPHFLDVRWFESEIWRAQDEAMDEHLRLLLLSFPPLLRDSGIHPDAFGQRLERFLSGVPEEAPIAVEVREPSHMSLEYARALAHFGASHVYTSAPGMPAFEEQVQMVPTAPELVFHLDDPVGAQYPSDAQRRHALVDLVLGHPDAPVFILVGDAAEGSAPRTIVRLMQDFAERSA